MNNTDGKGYELHRKQGESQEQYKQRLRLRESLARIKNTIMIISGDTGKPFVDEYPDSETARAVNAVIEGITGACSQ